MTVEAAEVRRGEETRWAALLREGGEAASAGQPKEKRRG